MIFDAETKKKAAWHIGGKQVSPFQKHCTIGKILEKFITGQNEREETTQDAIVTKSAAFASYEINYLTYITATYTIGPQQFLCLFLKFRLGMPGQKHILKILKVRVRKRSASISHMRFDQMVKLRVARSPPKGLRYIPRCCHL
jgi:hypothetical protein